MHRPPAQNPKAIIGKTGRLTSDLKAGEVATANIGAEDFTVTGSTDLPNGTLGRVKDIQGLRVIVEKAGEKEMLFNSVNLQASDNTLYVEKFFIIILLIIFFD